MTDTPLPNVAPAEIDPLIGRIIAGKYQIVRRVARGGMARIYGAIQLPLDRTVAVKLLDPQVASLEDATEFRVRFLREASTCAKLRHPNTVTVFDYGVHEDGALYMVMEFVEGRNLAQELKGGPFRPDRAVWIAHEVCRSLQEAHELGIVHRDLKASNLMVSPRTEGEVVKVVDFGIAKLLDADELTADATVIGTPRYMAPELILGEPVDARVDLYSLGIVMYEMLSGHPPFVREGTVKTLLAQVKETPPPLREACPTPLPRALIEVIGSLLEKRPEDRPSSAGELRHELQQVLVELGRDPEPSADQGPEVAPPVPRLIERPPSEPQRWPPLLVAALIVSLAFPGAAAIGTAAVESAVVDRLRAPLEETPVLTLTTRPMGAEVWERGQLRGETPLDLPLDGRSARVFELRMQGYAPELVVQRPTGRSVVVERELHLLDAPQVGWSPSRSELLLQR